jgi:hypothetical protein
VNTVTAEQHHPHQMMRQLLFGCDCGLQQLSSQRRMHQAEAEAAAAAAVPRRVSSSRAAAMQHGGLGQATSLQQLQLLWAQQQCWLLWGSSSLGTDCYTDAVAHCNPCVLAVQLARPHTVVLAQPRVVVLARSVAKHWDGVASDACA